MKILKICSNSKEINIIAILEIIVFITLYFLGSPIAKYHLIGWTVWLIILTLYRRYYFGTYRFHNDH
jgi:hypothetical protein